MTPLTVSIVDRSGRPLDPTAMSLREFDMQLAHGHGRVSSHVARTAEDKLLRAIYGTRPTKAERRRASGAISRGDRR